MSNEPLRAVFEQVWGGPRKKMIVIAIACQIDQFDVPTPISPALLAQEAEISEQEAHREAFDVHRDGVLNVWFDSRSGGLTALISRPDAEGGEG